MLNLSKDDARSYLSGTEKRFSLIQMSMIDTWASTGAGAFSLSENGLYTVQAWKVFLNRLQERGVFTVSRWHDPNNLGESARAVSLGAAALFELGVTNPSRARRDGYKWEHFDTSDKPKSIRFARHQHSKDPLPGTGV